MRRCPVLAAAGPGFHEPLVTVIGNDGYVRIRLGYEFVGDHVVYLVLSSAARVGARVVFAVRWRSRTERVGG